MSVTASPGISSIVSMTAKITPSSTGMASRRRRSANVSMASRCGGREAAAAASRRHRRSHSLACRLLVDPGLPEAQVVFHGMHGEPLHRGAGHHDLLGVVDGHPHHLLHEDVLDLAVELLALRLVQTPPCLL